MLWPRGKGESTDLFYRDQLASFKKSDSTVPSAIKFLKGTGPNSSPTQMLILIG